MSKPIPQGVRARLKKERNIWLVTVRPGSRPHMVPVWFVATEYSLYVSIEPRSVKGRNLISNKNVCLALENGAHPVICEGEAELMQEPWPPEVLELFEKKYGWDISAERQYTQLVEISCRKWLHW